MRDAVTNGLERPGPIDRIFAMSTQPTSPLPPGGATPPETGSAPSLARRRLLRGGLGAAPVLMAAAPRSVMAGGTCMTGSAYTSWSPSVAASRSPTMYTCSGKTPESWLATPLASWPSSCVNVDTKAGTVTPIKFGARFSPRHYGDDPSLVQVLQKTSTAGIDCMAKHIVAAYLNAAQGLTPLVVVDPVRVWSDFHGKGGFYEPTAGVRWGCDTGYPSGPGGITPWLRSTMSG
jgi:hypothetical protein